MEEVDGSPISERSENDDASAGESEGTENMNDVPDMSEEFSWLFAQHQPQQTQPPVPAPTEPESAPVPDVSEDEDDEEILFSPTEDETPPDDSVDEGFEDGDEKDFPNDHSNSSAPEPRDGRETVTSPPTKISDASSALPDVRAINSTSESQKNGDNEISISLGRLSSPFASSSVVRQGEAEYSSSSFLAVKNASNGASNALSQQKQTGQSGLASSFVSARGVFRKKPLLDFEGVIEFIKFFAFFPLRRRRV